MSRVAVVTGGTRGIGAAIAHTLSRAGHDLTLLGRDAAALQALAQRLTPPSKGGGRTHNVCADVTDAQAMQDAVPVGAGAMAAILGMTAADVVAGCAQAQATFASGSGEVVEAANFNDPSQTVIAGSKAAVEKACEILKAAGAKRALPLPVSAPFHSSLMLPAAEKLKERLATTSIAAPAIPVVNNIDVAVKTDANEIREALYRQAFGPVRWVECVAAIKARGAHTLVECGPGKVLAGLTKRIDAELTGLPLFDPATLAEVKVALA